jgi:hypothetical protein
MRFSFSTTSLFDVDPQYPREIPPVRGFFAISEAKIGF